MRVDGELRRPSFCSLLTNELLCFARIFARKYLKQSDWLSTLKIVASVRSLYSALQTKNCLPELLAVQITSCLVVPRSLNSHIYQQISFKIAKIIKPADLFWKLSSAAIKIKDVFQVKTVSNHCKMDNLNIFHQIPFKKCFIKSITPQGPSFLYILFGSRIKHITHMDCTLDSCTQLHYFLWEYWIWIFFLDGGDSFFNIVPFGFLANHFRNSAIHKSKALLCEKRYIK